jgi:hypothetical protein
MRSHVSRRFSAGIVVGLFALGVVGCGDDDDSETTDAPDETSGSEETPETLKVGFAYADLSEFAEVNPAYDTGDNEQQALAMVDYWLAEGLLPDGVEIDLVIRSFDPADDTTKVALCQQFAEEDEAVAVLANRTFATGAECLAERFQIPAISADPSPASVYERTAPYLFTLRSDESTTARNFVAYADDAGLLEGATLGLFFDTASQEAVDALRDELETRGYEIASEVETGGQGIGSDQDQLAVQQFKADGVDAVLPMIGGTTLTNFMTFADEQAYTPRYLDFDYSEHMVDAATAGRPASQIEGIDAISQNRVGDFSEGGEVSDDAQACLDNYDAYSGEPVDPAVPESATLNNILITCSLGEVLVAGLQAASDAGDLTADGIVAGLETIQGLPTSNWNSISFSSDDHSGSDTFRQVSFDAGCSCYVPEGEYEEFSVTD